MSESDSFIDEVAEEVRRDRLFALMRKYGWIGVAAVLLIVGGASWNEWHKARVEAASEAFGDAVMAAMTNPDPAERLSALASLSTDGMAGRAAVLGFLTASEAEAAGKHDDAVKAVQTVADDATMADSYRQLAQLKLVMMNGDKMDPAARDSTLTALAAPGAPYRPLALEQQALILLASGKNDEAADLLAKIAEDADATPALQGRVHDILIALGKPLPGN